MSITATFLVTNATRGEPLIYSHTRLDVYSECSYQFWERFWEDLDFEAFAKDQTIGAYVSDGYQHLSEDRNGERLRWCYGRDCTKALAVAERVFPDGFPPPDVESEYRAAKAYLAAIPTTKVVLYFSW